MKYHTNYVQVFWGMGIQRDYFRSEITLLTTSGQMARHIVINQKPTKSLKIDFGQKFKFL